MELRISGCRCGRSLVRTLTFGIQMHQVIAILTSFEFHSKLIIMYIQIAELSVSGDNYDTTLKEVKIGDWVLVQLPTEGTAGT